MHRVAIRGARGEAGRAGHNRVRIHEAEGSRLGWQWRHSHVVAETGHRVDGERHVVLRVL
jgi:hypothetical protein